LVIENTAAEDVMRRNLLFLLPIPLMILTGSAAANTLVVAAVHPGCVVEFEGGFMVHLTGIAVPEAESKNGWSADDFVKRRLVGKRVAVFTWTTDNTATGIVHGEDALAFAKVMYGADLSIDIASELLERGFARVDPENLPEGFEHYREIERHAKERRLGAWASGR
jgi:endonuclease YncB( thermonuclease family)